MLEDSGNSHHPTQPNAPDKPIFFNTNYDAENKASHIPNVNSSESVKKNKIGG